VPSWRPRQRPRLGSMIFSMTLCGKSTSGSRQSPTRPAGVPAALHPAARVADCVKWYSLIWFVKSTAEPPTTPWRRARRSVWYSRDSREDSRDSREDSGYSREALTRYCSQGSYCSAVSKWHFILRNWCQILMWASLMMLLATDPEIRFLKADCCSNWTDKHTVETKHVSSECDIQCWWTST
jgi:hypothetical protein